MGCSTSVLQPKRSTLAPVEISVLPAPPNHSNTNNNSAHLPPNWMVLLGEDRGEAHSPKGHDDDVSARNNNSFSTIRHHSLTTHNNTSLPKIPGHEVDDNSHHNNHNNGAEGGGVVGFSYPVKLVRMMGGTSAEDVDGSITTEGASFSTLPPESPTIATEYIMPHNVMALKCFAEKELARGVPLSDVLVGGLRIGDVDHSIRRTDLDWMWVWYWMESDGVFLARASISAESLVLSASSIVPPVPSQSE
eukprot:PhF_6_TR18878/c7_g1_i1/m.27479